MILFQQIESRIDELRVAFRSAHPFRHVVLGEFGDPDRLASAIKNLPDPRVEGIRSSRDYVFAKNKFEKHDFRSICPELEELYQDFTAERFRVILRAITGEEVFIDPDFFGGGLHQGGSGSFLDLHADFSYHPLHADWFRNLNILLYLNPAWEPEHGGELRLRHRETGDEVSISPMFNRCVIMLTRDYTLHGYERTRFPEGEYRRSLAAYGYSHSDGQHGKRRSTVWYPDRGGFPKRWLGRSWPKLVWAKNRLFGSGTSKNR